jgi:hypothetical protein
MAVWFPPELYILWGGKLGDDGRIKFGKYGCVDLNAQGGLKDNLIAHWIELTNEPYQAQLGAQHVTPIYDALGWSQYTSKHASRGLSNYQRNPASIPAGWKNIGTGRMWGKLGDWEGVAVDPMRLDLPFGAFHLLRRITRGYCKAKARLALDKARNARQALLARRRVTWTRRMLRCTDINLSGVRGLNEWMPLAEQLRALAFFARLGFEIIS